jgi:hypothetical protein
MMIEHYFHGSASKFKVGDLLLPPSVTGAASYRDAKDEVYVSTDLFYAIAMATDRRSAYLPAPQKAWLYLVKPDELEPHDTEIFWGFGSNPDRGAALSGPLFTTPQARVLTRTVVPAFFTDNRGHLIRNYFQTFAKLMRRKDHFLRVNINEDRDGPPDEPPQWRVTRGTETKWDSFELSWESLQNPVANRKQWKSRADRFFEYLDEHADELVDAAEEAPEVFRNLLDAVGLHYERCGDCGDFLRDRERSDGVCLHCRAKQPD